jgi:CYTH domain-containing protein
MKKIIEFLGLKKVAIAIALEIFKKILADNGILLDKNRKTFDFTMPIADLKRFLPKFIIEKVPNQKHTFSYSDSVNEVNVVVIGDRENVFVNGTQIVKQ